MKWVIKRATTDSDAPFHLISREGVVPFDDIKETDWGWFLYKKGSRVAGLPKEHDMIVNLNEWKKKLKGGENE